MKSKASFFSISMPLMKENVRRFWAIPVLSFLLYFLIVVFPIIITRQNPDQINQYLRSLLMNNNDPIMLVNLCFPIITAVILFRYLRNPGSVSVIHSMPFTRAQLFHSNFITGILLVYLPILINGLILLALSTPVYSDYTYLDGKPVPEPGAYDIFTHGAVGHWMWEALLIVLVIYAISVLAGIVTGNTVMHLASSVGLNFVLPGLYGLLLLFGSVYLFGFSIGINQTKFLFSLSPYTNIFYSGEHFSTGWTVYYILLFLIVYAAAAFLYGTRKLERVTDSLVFAGLRPIAGFLITFVGMTGVGMYCFYLKHSYAFLYIGLFLGGVLFCIIGEMIIQKTLKVFNRKCVKDFVIYAIILVLFLGCIQFDVTGYGKRVPNLAKIDSVYMTDQYGDTGFDYSSYHRTYNNSYLSRKGPQNRFQLKDPSNIKAFTELHHTIINQKKALSYDRLDPNETCTDFGFTYQMGKSFMNRQYCLDHKFFNNSKALKEIYESKEYKSIHSLKQLNWDKITSITFNPTGYGVESVTITDKQQINEILTLMEEDYMNLSYEQMQERPHSVATATISLVPQINTARGSYIDHTQYNIDGNFTKTVQWFKDHNYYDNFIQKTEYIDSITFYNIDQTKENEASKEDILVIDDPNKIKDILENYNLQGQGNLPYAKIVYNKDAFSKNNLIDGSMDDDQFHQCCDTCIYFTENTLPSYVKDYFKIK